MDNSNETTSGASASTNDQAKAHPAPPADDASGTWTCPDCDFDRIHRLICRSEHDKKLNDVRVESLAILQSRWDGFNAAQKAYIEARTADRPIVNAARQKLNGLIEEIVCRLNRRHRECLEREWQALLTEIRACRGPVGCRPVQHVFAGEVSDAPSGAAGAPPLIGRAHQYRTVAEQLKVYFDELLTEIQDVTARATKLRDDVEVLATDSAGDADRDTTLRLYARALALKWDADDENIWSGFATSKAYIDCLCAVITQLTEAWECIAVLEAAAAERDCCGRQAKARCDALQQQPVEQLLERYEHHCTDYARPPDDGSGGDPPENPPNDNPGRPCPCGCGHRE